MIAPSRCPWCESWCECSDHKEVDIGVGIQEYDHVWTCPNCGDWRVETTDADLREGVSRFLFRDRGAIVLLSWGTGPKTRIPA
jgi:hypothetical protein